MQSDIIPIQPVTVSNQNRQSISAVSSYQGVEVIPVEAIPLTAPNTQNDSVNDIQPIFPHVDVLPMDNPKNIPIQPLITPPQQPVVIETNQNNSVHQIPLYQDKNSQKSSDLSETANDIRIEKMPVVASTTTTLQSAPSVQSSSYVTVSEPFDSRTFLNNSTDSSHIVISSSSDILSIPTATLAPPTYQQSIPTAMIPQEINNQYINTVSPMFQPYIQNNTLVHPLFGQIPLVNVNQLSTKTNKFFKILLNKKDVLPFIDNRLPPTEQYVLLKRILGREQVLSWCSNCHKNTLSKVDFRITFGKFMTRGIYSLVSDNGKKAFHKCSVCHYPLGAEKDPYTVLIKDLSK
ncbi:hypothetical protein WA158_001265 [Blastocystis sp. Blastoise]